MLEIAATFGFPGHVVLTDFELSVAPGEGVALVGRNGSGKTTLLRTVAGLQSPRAGSVLVDGHRAHERRCRQLVGFIPDPPPLYEELTPWEHLELVSRLWGGVVRSEDLAASVERLELTGFLHQRCDTVSLGLRKRLGIALATVHRPRLLLCDEPFNGLDKQTTERVRRLLRDHLAGGGAFVASSHQAEALAGVCTRTVELPGGQTDAPDEVDPVTDTTPGPAHDRVDPDPDAGRKPHARLAAR